MNDTLAEVIRLLITEEFIGQKGNVNYYQMGGSISSPALYNLDSKGRPTRDPGVSGLKKPRRSKSKRKSQREKRP